MVEKNSENGFFVLKPTLKLPHDWKEKIDKYMKKNSIFSYSELVRYLIRKEIIEKGGNK